MTFSSELLRIDPAAETQRLVAALRRTAGHAARRGGVVGISGGVDSSVALALSVRAFGPERTIALMMPEKDSSPLSEQLARAVAAQFGVVPVKEDITAALEGIGCYRRRDEAIRRVFPDYDAERGYKAKITLPPAVLDAGTLNVFALTIIGPDGAARTERLAPPEFLQIVAASNLKQRTRMATAYYHAELRNYLVLGTANKNEHDQGFFVKHGDAGVDVNLLVHLYKTQVYQLAEYLDIPPAIRLRTPTSDTYSAPCDQQEFFFRLPFSTLDVLWYGWENGVESADVASALGLTPQQVQHAYDDFTRKRRTTDFLRLAPIALGN